MVSTSESLGKEEEKMDLEKNSQKTATHEDGLCEQDYHINFLHLAIISI